MLTPEDKRRYVCGSTKQMAGECDKRRREESAGKETPKGDKAKSDKGKAKGKHGDAGQGKPQVKQLGEADANATKGRELRQQNSSRD